MVNLTSQSICTRLDAMLRAYECNHANSYIHFFFMVHAQYFSSQYYLMPCNHHVNTSIPHALTYHFSPQFMLFISINNMQETHIDNFSPKISSGPSQTVPYQAVEYPRTVPPPPHQAFGPISLGPECMAISSLTTPKTIFMAF